jgi:hypothetical protein
MYRTEIIININLYYLQQKKLWCFIKYAFVCILCYIDSVHTKINIINNLKTNKLHRWGGVGEVDSQYKHESDRLKNFTI